MTAQNIRQPRKLEINDKNLSPSTYRSHQIASSCIQWNVLLNVLRKRMTELTVARRRLAIRRHPYLHWLRTRFYGQYWMPSAPPYRFSITNSGDRGQLVSANPSASDRAFRKSLIHCWYNDEAASRHRETQISCEARPFGNKRGAPIWK